MRKHDASHFLCDIVMAGGVTSGIVYPGAISKISKRYSFQAIGGTSVGAITAAVTAAAEYGRRTGKNPRSFDGIAAIPEELGQTMCDGHSRLFHLFSPDIRTRPLFNIAVAFIMKSSNMGVRRRLCTLGGVVLGAPVIWGPAIVIQSVGVWQGITLWSSGYWFSAVLSSLMSILASGLTFGLGVALMFYKRWLPDLCRNNFGLCLGKEQYNQAASSRPSNAVEALTPWIHHKIQTAAGLKFEDDPLTFGDLWRAPRRGAGDAIKNEVQTAESAWHPESAPRSIEVAMQTSDISRNRALQLPFIESLSPLYVEVATLKKYFPPEVVTCMVNASAKRPIDHIDKRLDLPAGVIRIPLPEDIPLVFAARLSLSFPILLSAFPMKAPDYASIENGKIPLADVWFSDGGLTSNMPIHFFDAPLPAHPTFGLNLIGVKQSLGHRPESEHTDYEYPDHSMRAQTRSPNERLVQLGSNRRLPIQYRALDTHSGLGAFVECLFNTARCWSDYQNLLAPGTRDRVVHIGLVDGEGGLCLDMSAEVIRKLNDRGIQAGAAIRNLFDPAADAGCTDSSSPHPFAAHRWIRMRNTVAAAEDYVRRLAISLKDSEAAAIDRNEPTLKDMLSPGGRVTESRMGPIARETAVRLLNELVALGDYLADSERRSHNSSTLKGGPLPAQRIMLHSVQKDPRAQNPIE